MCASGGSFFPLKMISFFYPNMQTKTQARVPIDTQHQMPRERRQSIRPRNNRRYNTRTITLIKGRRADRFVPADRSFIYFFYFFYLFLHHHCIL